MQDKKKFISDCDAYSAKLYLTLSNGERVLSDWTNGEEKSVALVESGEKDCKEAACQKEKRDQDIRCKSKKKELRALEVTLR